MKLIRRSGFIAFAAVLLAFLPLKSALADYGVQTKTSGCVSNQTLPDPSCTPGAVLTTDISLICKKGYTKTVRNISLKVRKKVFAEYGIPYSQSSKYEVDHLISLELGGSNDISNLWPEISKPKNGALTKDKFENYLHEQVCKGLILIQDAQTEIATNWLAYYPPLKFQTKPLVQEPILRTPSNLNQPIPNENQLLYPLLLL